MSRMQPDPLGAGGDLTFPAGKTVVYCIGAQKAGTTWLGDYVSAHPDCYLPAMKECHFFDVRSGADMQARRVAIRSMTRAFNRMKGSGPEAFAAALNDLQLAAERAELFTPGDRGLRAYMKLMRDPTGRATHLCDFTPAYATCDRATFAEMDSLAETARFVFILRDPLSRMWSQARMGGKEMLEERSEASFTAEARRLLNHYLGNYRASALPRNNYARTIEELESVIPPDRILYLFYETLFTEDSIRRFCDFVGISWQQPDFAAGSNVGLPLDMPEALAIELRAELQGQYSFVRRKFGDLVPASWGNPEADRLAPLPPAGPPT